MLPNPRAYEPQSPVEIFGNGIRATPYTSFESGFVSAIVGAAFLSALSVLMLVCMNAVRPAQYLAAHTHVKAIFGSLLLANVLQAAGTLLNARWVLDGGVTSGALCSVQGAIKQAGNVGTAVWSFALALHAFRLLFLRAHVSRRGKWLTLALGWAFVALVVGLGPLALQHKDRGPYFGPSGFWCWITSEYRLAQTFLEYFFEWLSALSSFVLYAAVLLRVRGNLVQDSAGRCALRWVPRAESWQLAFARDYLDSSMVKVAAIIVWYPVTYTLLVVPISIARFASYAGHPVPQACTFLADLVFALGGFANLLLFLRTRRRIPDPATIPAFATPRARVEKGSPRAAGITPFVLAEPEFAREGMAEEVDAKANNRASTGSAFSVASHESVAPLVRAGASRV
ncbi:hypothetical protein BC834DRAFT_882401 [Gloeopeniophorella convolvens]|nr:hypothetical protein BC834DRAFT_882401 [Gloeopeniophorella convolvens]